MDGDGIAFNLASALFNLGFPWDQIGSEGLKVVDRFQASEEEGDPEMLSQMREYFEGLLRNPPDELPQTFEPFSGPSEYMVVNQLIASLEDLAGDLPWVAEPIHDILNDYNEYLKSVKAPTKLQERADRIRHSINDLEANASGRG